MKYTIKLNEAEAEALLKICRNCNSCHRCEEITNFWIDKVFDKIASKLFERKTFIERFRWIMRLYVALKCGYKEFKRRLKNGN